MRTGIFTQTLGLTLAATGAAARGAVPDAIVDCGLQATFSHPEGNLNTLLASAKGYGGGIFKDYRASDVALWRPRFDVSYCSGTTWGIGQTEDTSRQWTTYALGADYLLYYGSERKGFYLTAGLAAATVREAFFGFDLGGRTTTFTKRTTHLQEALGLGYGLTRNWEGSLRYTRTAAMGLKNLSGLNIGVAYRFGPGSASE